ncbi:MAG: M4 family metallopeptidase [Pseudomonadales bacterium]
MKRLLLVALISLGCIGASHAETIFVDGVTKSASYIKSARHQARESGEAAARFYLKKYRKNLGINDLDDDLRLISKVGIAGSIRYNFQQLVSGRRVLDGIVGVTLGADDKTLISITSAYNPSASTVQQSVKIKAREAVEIARRILPSATEARARELVLMQPVPTSAELKFVWLVDLEDPTVGTMMTYAVDAVDGFIEDSIALRHSAMDRLTKDAQSNQTRQEGDGAIGNAHVDGAHDATGAVYDYFYKQLQFDSFDGAGGTIQALVNDPKSKDNAYYKHKSKGLFFGPGMAALDVVVHEFAHGVVAHTAGLIYKGQSGALNESYADVFGVVVDKDDWLLGEDLPKSFLGSKPALRNVKSPSALNQPGQVKDYQSLCGVDQDGVHTNSGIPNRGFYEVASRIGRADAGKIYFSALAQLSPKADFNAHRQATLDATQAVFPGDDKKLKAVSDGLAAAGLVEGMSIQVCPTSSCPIAGAANRLRGEERKEFGRDVAAAYRLRDEVLRRHKVIGDYTLDKYGELSGDLATTVFTNPSMALDVLSYVRKIAPVINRVGDSEFEHRVTDDLVDATKAIISKIQEAFEKAGKEQASSKLKRLAEQFDLERLKGQSYAEAMDIVRDMVKEAKKGEEEDQGKGRGKSQEQQSKGKGQRPEQQESQGKGQQPEQPKQPEDQGQSEQQQKSRDQGQAEEDQSSGGQAPQDKGPGKEQGQAKDGAPQTGAENQAPGSQNQETDKPDMQQPQKPITPTPSNRRRPARPGQGGQSRDGDESPEPQPAPKPNCC